MAETPWHNLSSEKAVEILETNIKEGLSEERVKELQKEFGKNILPKKKSLSKLKMYLEQLKSPLIYILIIAGFITLALREWADSIVIFGAIIVNTAVGFFQENKASQTLRELKKIIRHKAEVLRGGNLKIVDTKDLVPGDIFILNPGDKVPADGRIISSFNLSMNEMALTGEWLSAQKIDKVLPRETSLAERDNMVYMGTIVEDGKGEAIVIETGNNTEIGKVAALVRETKEEKTPYQRKLSHFSTMVGTIIGLVCFFIFFEGILTGGEFVEMFTTAVAVAVAAIPEGLPVAMTVILALGMQRILKKRGLVRKLVAAETLGSVSVICSDKTGTLTEAKMQVAGIYTANREILSDGEKYSEKIEKDGHTSYALVLRIAALASEAFIENPDEPLEKWIVRGKPTEKAVLLAAIQAGFSKKELEKEYPKLKELPFGPVHKYSATLNKLSVKENILNVLGAPEIILAASKFLDIDGKINKLSDRDFKKLKEKSEELANNGQRILAAAYRKIKNSEFKDQNLKELCNELVFVGIIALHDPLRRDAKRAVRSCKMAGIRPIIVTGDHRLTAEAIAENLGIPAKDINIIDGVELKKLSDKEFKERLKELTIYARVEPEQKMRIIGAWQEKGEVVAMTGDGINDAPALKKADIGIALGSGTEVAKETSDLILLNDSFSIIVAAVEEGRAIIDNIRKVITYLLSDSFTEIILIGASILLGWPLPVVAVQILWVNLIEDGPLGLCLAFEPKEKDLMRQKPQGHNIPLLTREMKALVFIIGLVTDFLLLGLLFWLIKYSGYEIPHIRSVIFAGLTIDSIFYIFSCKSLRRNIWQINPFSNKFLVFAWIFGLIALTAALYLPALQTLLKTVPLNLFDWQLILSLGLLNIILIEATKWYFIIRRETA